MLSSFILWQSLPHLSCGGRTYPSIDVSSNEHRGAYPRRVPGFTGPSVAAWLRLKANQSIAVPPNPYQASAVENIFDLENYVFQDVNRTLFPYGDFFSNQEAHAMWRAMLPGRERRELWWRELKRDGLFVNAFGMDITEVVKTRFGLHAGDMLEVGPLLEEDDNGFTSAHNVSWEKSSWKDRIALFHAESRYEREFMMINSEKMSLGSSWDRLSGFDQQLNWLQETYYNTRLRKFFWHVDLPNYFRGWDGNRECGTERGRLGERVPTFSRKEARMVRQFRRDGFLKLEHWTGLPPRRPEFGHIPTSKSRKQNTHLHDSWGSPAYDRGFLNALLEPGSLLRKLVHGYLGTRDVAYAGSLHMLLHGKDGKVMENRLWHHDGCGSRLKAWIYLRDVPSSRRGGMPTKMLRGTQRMQYFEPTQFFEGPEMGLCKLRNDTLYEEFGLKEESVDNVVPVEAEEESHYSSYGPVVEMSGPQFGGFIFDTNTIHGAAISHDIQNKTVREVLVLEFAAVEHSERLPRTPHSVQNGYGWRSGTVPEGTCHPKDPSQWIQWDYCSVDSSDWVDAWERRKTRGEHDLLFWHFPTDQNGAFVKFG